MRILISWEEILLSHISFLYAIIVKVKLQMLHKYEKMKSQIQEDDTAYFDEESLARTKEAMLAFRDYCSSINMECAVFIISDKKQFFKENIDDKVVWAPNSNLINILDRAGLEYIDPVQIFIKNKPEDLYNKALSGHLSVKGHRLVSEIIVDHLEKKGLSPRTQQ